MSKHGALSGGWHIDPTVIIDGMLPGRLADGFAQAFEGWTGASYKPLVYCGTQVLGDVNHMLICEATKVTNPSEKEIAKVILRETLPKEGTLSGDYSLLYIESLA